MLARHPAPTILPFPVQVGREAPDLASAILVHLDDQWQPRSLDTWTRLLPKHSRATIHRMLGSLTACGRIEVLAGTGTRPAAYRLAQADGCPTLPHSLEARIADLEQLVTMLQATVERLQAASHHRETQDQVVAVVSHSISSVETQRPCISGGETQGMLCISPDETQSGDEDAFEALIRAQLEGRGYLSPASQPETQSPLTLTSTFNESDSLTFNETNVDDETQTPAAILQRFGLTERQAEAVILQHRLTVSEAEAWVRWGKSLQGVRSPVAIVVSKLHQQRVPPPTRCYVPHYNVATLCSIKI